MQKSKKEAGFSLTEILVVIVIIGILVLLAMPKFMSVITRAKDTEAKIQLHHLHNLQTMYFFQNDRFSQNLIELGFEQQKLIQEGGRARYRIEIVSANQNQYAARAVSVVDGDGDGQFSVWQVNHDGEIQQTQGD